MKTKSKGRLVVAQKPARSTNGKLNGRATSKKAVFKSVATKKATSKKRVYFFGAGKAEGGANMKDLLGGKGANLADMTSIGLPVPPGFTITTESCAEYNNLGQQLPRGLMDEVRMNLARVEKASGRKF